MFGLRQAEDNNGYSPSFGAVIFIEPPQEVNETNYPRPVLYAFSQAFSPLAHACVRGMKDTVVSLLANGNNVDQGYIRETPNGTNITPLQIACAEYVGSKQGKYLKIVSFLVSYGANIHCASFWVSEPNRLDVLQRNQTKTRVQSIEKALDKLRNDLVKMQSRQDYIQDEIRRYPGSLPPPHIDQREQLELIKNIQAYQERFDMVEVQLNNENKLLAELEKRLVSRKQINASPYVIALRERQRCSDIQLVEAMVEGAITLKNEIFGVLKKIDFNEESVQVIVEYITGLTLRLWDV